MNLLGQKIKEIREQQNLSQLELANLVGVHQTKISHCETGARGVSLKLMRKLSKAIDVSFDDLVASAVETERQREVA